MKQIFAIFGIFTGLLFLTACNFDGAALVGSDNGYTPYDSDDYGCLSSVPSSQTAAFCTEGRMFFDEYSRFVPTDHCSYVTRDHAILSVSYDTSANPPVVSLTTTRYAYQSFGETKYAYTQIKTLEFIDPTDTDNILKMSCSDQGSGKTRCVYSGPNNGSTPPQGNYYLHKLVTDQAQVDYYSSTITYRDTDVEENDRPRCDLRRLSQDRIVGYVIFPAYVVR